MNHFEQIMAIAGAEELQASVRKWKTLSENLGSLPKEAPILLPDMLWVARSGVGRTKLLTLISGYLTKETHLMEFYGDVPFFEFLLNYCSPQEELTELQRLIDAASEAAGFRSLFKGVVHVDVEEWLDHYEEKHFMTLMEYLAVKSRDWLVVLSVQSEDHPKLAGLEAFVSMFLRIERINLHLPAVDDLLDHMAGFLEKYRLSLSEDGRALLRDTVKVLCNNRYFDGYKTLELLCQDIAYHVFSAGPVENYVLGKEALADFSADSGYIKRTIFNIEKRIGFGG